MNKVRGVVAGEYGRTISLTVVDADGTAVDLSAYTAAALSALSPDETTSLSLTATIVTASAGVISITPDSDNFFSRDGDWLAQFQFSDTGVSVYTVPFIFDVERAI